MPFIEKIISLFGVLVDFLDLQENYRWYLLIIVSSISGYYVGFRKSKKKFNYLKGRYELIYVQLRQILLDIYINTVRSTSYPSFIDRAKNSLEILTKRRRSSIWLKIKKSILALFDKGINVSYGYDGGIFSLKKIRDVITNNMKYADKELVNKLQKAERAVFDSSMIGRDFDEELLKEEFGLCDHIFRNYEKLNRLFSS